MADPREPRAASSHVERGALWSAIERRTAAALAGGALAPIDTETVPAPDGGIPFAVRVVRALRRKERAAASRERRDPFLAPEPELVVGSVGDAHLCVLNKYPVIPHHALIVTRDFEEQDAPLARRDFEALWTCVLEPNTLGFYNAGAVAGASERHRHLQIVPTPLVAAPLATPLDAVLDDAHFADGIGRVAALPFLHGIGRLRAIAGAAPADAARVLHGLYQELARAFGCHRYAQPYNLLICRDWMMLVPRARDRWRGIPVNALGFAGALLVRGRAELAALRREGPLRVLARVAVPIDGG